MPSYITFVDFLLGGVGVYLIKSIFFATPERKSGPLPPGPKQLPLIGNLLDLPKGQEWVHWTKHKDLYGQHVDLWFRTYSDIITGPISSVTIFGQHMIIVNDKRLVSEMFDKRSAIYSDRPTLVFGGEMCVLNDYDIRLCRLMTRNNTQVWVGEHARASALLREVPLVPKSLPSCDGHQGCHRSLSFSRRNRNSALSPACA